MHRVFVVAVALGMAACASPEKIERGAAAHERRAAELEAQGEYQKAADEREAAMKEREKAARRASETHY